MVFQHKLSLSGSEYEDDETTRDGNSVESKLSMRLGLSQSLLHELSLKSVGCTDWFAALARYINSAVSHIEND